MIGQPAHLAAFHERQRAAALEELRPMLIEAQRLRESGLTWDECAAELRAQGFTGRSGQRLTTAAAYLAWRKHSAHL